MNYVINARTASLPRRATAVSATSSFWKNICLALGHAPDHTPLAALLKAVHGLEGNWMIASPVHWKAGHNDVQLYPLADTLGKEEGLARIWFAEISGFLAQDGLSLVYHDAQTWLISTKEKLPLQAPDVDSLPERSLAAVLADMPRDPYWLQIITELQMFCSNHPLNHRKEVPVNGLWFWGGAPLVPVAENALLTDSPDMQSVLPGALRLEAGATIDRNTTVIIENLTPEWQSILAKSAGKNTCTWYWNNIAYRSAPRFWWQRLKERLSHAD